MPASFGLLLVTGAQTHQENYARAFAADPRCRLVGVADEADVDERRRRLNRQLADELGIPVFEDLEQALLRDDVDLVSICAEPHRCGRIALAAARAGKHIYFDKDPAVNAAEARAVAAAVRKAGVRSQAFSLVRAPLAERAREALQAGRLGEPLALHCELMFAKGPAGTAVLGEPRRESAIADRFHFVDSKRELLCVGWYPLVLFQWLTQRRFTQIYATTANYYFAAHQRNGVEDFACLTLEMEGGLEATICVGRTGWQSHPSHGVHQLQIVGTQGVLDIDAHSPRLEILSDAAPWRPPVVPHPEDPMGFWSSTQAAGGVLPKSDWIGIDRAAKSDAACFLDCLEQERESDVPIETAVHTVEVILAAYGAAAARKMVRL